jgi:hypothetical protein
MKRNIENMTSKRVLILIIIMCLILLILPYDLLNRIKFGCFSIDISYYKDWATFISGITSPILSLFTIILVFKTFLTQKKDLEDSKELLSIQNEIINSQTKIAEKQNSIIQKQQFDDIFFRILGLYQKNINKYKIQINDPTLKNKTSELSGINYLNYKYLEFIDIIGEEFNSITANSFINQTSNIREDYKEIINIVYSQFRRLILIIHDSEIPNKQFYYDITKETLSHQELSTILLGCILKIDPEFNIVLIKIDFWKDARVYSNLENLLPDFILHI